MGLDFSGLIALSGKSPWEEIRQGKANDLKMVMMQESLTQKGLDEQLAAQKQLGEYQQILAEASSRVMPPDFDRLKEHEQTLRADFKKKLTEGLQKSNGNLKKWIESGGVIDMNNYKNSLLEGEAMQTGLQNAHNYGLAFADRKAGLTARDVKRLDASGQPVLMDVNEQFEKFKKGDIKNLEYDGAYQMPVFDTKVFNEIIGNPNDPYQVIPVDAKSLGNIAYIEFIRKGVPEEDAVLAAKKYQRDYAKGLESGAKPYTFGYQTRPTPQRETSFSLGERAKIEDAKYVIEQLGKAMTGSDDVYRPTTGKKLSKKVDDKEVWEDATWKRGTALSGTSLGKFSYTNTKDKSVEPKTSDNLIVDWIFQDGKAMIKTTQSQFARDNGAKIVNGNPVNRFGYMPVTDDIISGIAVAKGIPYRSLREGLIQLGAYGSQTPETEKAVGGGDVFMQDKVINGVSRKVYQRPDGSKYAK